MMEGIGIRPGRFLVHKVSVGLRFGCTRNRVGKCLPPPGS